MTAPFPELLPLRNPFGAPVYYRERLSSTMDESRRLASRGAPHGTVAVAGFQDAGRGRNNRPWSAAPEESLLFTILLRCPCGVLPAALTLRAGLALALAVEDFAPALKGQVQVKWPNDLMIRSRKAAGILTEGDGELVFIGMGVNVAQTEFPEAVRSKAVSIAEALAEGGPPRPSPGGGGRFLLLERILSRLYRELPEAEAKADDSWRRRLEERLFRRGEAVRFIDGEAGSGRIVEGVLEGLGPGGELLIKVPGLPGPASFITGELDAYAGL